MLVNDIITALEEYLDKPVIFTNQAAPKPPYPYIGVTETSAFIPAPGLPSVENEHLPEDINQIATSQPTKVLSITAYGLGISETAELAQQARDWFDFVGYRTLKEMGVTVADLGATGNRDTLIVDDYERRRGFDVTLRFVHRQERLLEEIKTVNYEFKRSEV